MFNLEIQSDHNNRITLFQRLPISNIKGMLMLQEYI